MPISRQSLSETLSDDLASLHKARAALSNAWALRMSASLKAHFAAVMDNSLTRNCREQGWSVDQDTLSGLGTYKVGMEAGLHRWLLTVALAARSYHGDLATL